MQNNYSQKIFMQIPQENTYTGLALKPDLNEEFDRLSNNYKIRQINDVKSFIENHENIIGFIHEITPLIKEYFPEHEKFIDFCKDPEFSDLDFIMIYIESENYDKDSVTLEKFEDEPLYMSKFSKKINGLVCVDLW